MSEFGIKNRKAKEMRNEKYDLNEKLTDEFSPSENEDHPSEKKWALEKKEVLQQSMRNVPIAVKPLSKQNIALTEQEIQHFLFISALQRTIYTLLMLFAFVIIVAAGPLYCALLIIAITAGIFREIINLKRNVSRENGIPYFIVINWYFFFVGIFYFYGQFLAQSLEESKLEVSYLRWLQHYHKFVSFLLWTAGFLGFVMSLRKGYYRYQFRIFGWTHLTLFIVVAQTSVIVVNLYTGIVWFILPALLVITNDIFAYVFGKMYGKTKLIDLSPNKTWEGFIGGFFSSLFFALLFSYLFQMLPSLTCENEVHQVALFSFSKCQVSDLFLSQPHELPFIFQGFGIQNIYFSEFQKHSLVLSLFASLIAPFGGFFASGLKRALDVKDFGQAIPGHGGITDRMDCQLLMGTFTFCYLNYVIMHGNAINSIPGIIASFQYLTHEHQRQVLDQLTAIAANQINPAH